LPCANSVLTHIHRDKKAELFESANKKYEEACNACNTHAVLTKWGNLLLNKGIEEKKRGQKAEADEYFTESRSKYDKALELKHDYEEALYNLSRSLREQAEIKEGNHKFWFASQAAEKEKLLADVKAGVPTSSTPSAPSPENKIKKAIEDKEKGNDCFRKGDLPGALRNWHNALNGLNGAYGFSAKQEVIVKDTKLAVLNNMSNVFIKQSKYDRAIERLNEVLTLDPNNVKGLFRRGKAYLANNDVDKARADLLRARDAAPEDKEIKNELILLERKEKTQDAKQKQFYAKMF
jgi:tetratricopeptide (TPR) repeat protein